MNSLSEFLKGIGMHRYLAVFEQHDIDLETLRLLSERDLECLGVSLGHRKRLLIVVSELNSASSATAPSETEGHELGVDGERRQLTVLFCDIVGSTELTSRLDPESLRRVLRRYETICSKAISRFDGYVFQRQGDGIVAYFGFPVAHEEAPERAIRAGLKILENVPQLGSPETGPLNVRIGISTGVVVVSDLRSRDNTAFGDAMNLAARLQTIAQPGTIAISDSTRRLAAGSFEYEDLGSQILKGFPNAMQVWRVLGPSSVEGRFEAATLGGLSPLVGRKREVTLLLQRWQLSEQGTGQAMIISGEAGVGKSRVLKALRDEVGPRATNVLRFQCSPFFGNTALYPVIDYLERELRLIPDEPAAAKLDRLEALMVGRYGRELCGIPSLNPHQRSLWTSQLEPAAAKRGDNPVFNRAHSSHYKERPYADAF
jgi:class 3 adenylate cyclase